MFVISNLAKQIVFLNIHEVCLKANQIVLQPEAFSELDMWVNKVLYRMKDFGGETKEIQLQQIDMSLEGIGAPVYVREKVKNLVTQKLRL